MAELVDARSQEWLVSRSSEAVKLVIALIALFVFWDHWASVAGAFEHIWIYSKLLEFWKTPDFQSCFRTSHIYSAFCWKCYGLAIQALSSCFRLCFLVIQTNKIKWAWNGRLVQIKLWWLKQYIFDWHYHGARSTGTPKHWKLHDKGTLNMECRKNMPLNDVGANFRHSPLWV